MCSLCTPRLPVLRKARVGGQRQRGLGEDRRASRPARVRAARTQRGPRPLAAAAASTASSSNSSARVRPQPCQRGLACGGAIRRCRRPGAPPSRRHAAGGSALPSAPCRRWRPARRRWNRAAAPTAASARWRPSALRSTVKAKSPRGSSTSVRLQVVALVAQEGELVLVVVLRAFGSPASVSTPRAWPIRSSAMLVSAMSSSSDRRVAAPLGQALAEDQAGVADAQQVLQLRVGGELDRGLHRGAHMWSTDSGSL